MIRWLVQSMNDDPELAEGIPPAGVLSPWEEAHWADLRTEKRRRDWLLGRWTAKRLLQMALAEELGLHLPLGVLIVASRRDGSPEVILPSVPLQGIRLSISHSDGRAFCALAQLIPRRRDSGRATGCVQLGADIERIAWRSTDFVEQYFTPAEIAAVRSAPLEARDALVTAIWSAKESVLKALRLGLTVDTRAVSCDVDLPVCGSASNGCDGLWQPYAIAAGSLLAQTGHDDCGEAAWTGYWRISGGHVLTLAVLNDTWLSDTGLNDTCLHGTLPHGMLPHSAVPHGALPPGTVPHDPLATILRSSC